jgi:hypothetical protein
VTENLKRHEKWVQICVLAKYEEMFRGKLRYRKINEASFSKDYGVSGFRPSSGF